MSKLNTKPIVKQILESEEFELGSFSSGLKDSKNDYELVERLKNRFEISGKFKKMFEENTVVTRSLDWGTDLRDCFDAGEEIKVSTLSKYIMYPNYRTYNSDRILSGNVQIFGGSCIIHKVQTKEIPYSMKFIGADVISDSLFIVSSKYVLKGASLGIKDKASKWTDFRHVVSFKFEVGKPSKLYIDSDVDNNVTEKIVIVVRSSGNESTIDLEKFTAMTEVTIDFEEGAVDNYLEFTGVSDRINFKVSGDVGLNKLRVSG